MIIRSYFLAIECVIALFVSAVGDHLTVAGVSAVTNFVTGR
ncbi:hypothetical protein [Curtobacterium flaccumfaciens]|nr:hypothetical protein [Curtobacterium flaccumfaciens]